MAPLQTFAPARNRNFILPVMLMAMPSARVHNQFINGGPGVRLRKRHQKKG
jgi:hypothetical protein